MGAPTMAPALPGAGCPRSLATRSATEIAAMRRGCVQIRLARAPRPPSMAASSRNWGTWAVAGLGVRASVGGPGLTARVIGKGRAEALPQVACWAMRACKLSCVQQDPQHLH